MLFMGKKLTAEEAREAHLIAEVIPRDQLLPEVGERAVTVAWTIKS
jgi:enoyl-CoA hydratase/carnithine racemase